MLTAAQTLVHVHCTKCNAILTGTYLIKNYLVLFQYESIMFNLYVKNMKAVLKIGKRFWPSLILGNWQNLVNILIN